MGLHAAERSRTWRRGAWTVKPKRRPVIGKMIDCGKVNPASGCGHVIRGESEEDVLRQAGEHAKEHGMEPSPELLAQVRANIEES